MSATVTETQHGINAVEQRSPSPARDGRESAEGNNAARTADSGGEASQQPPATAMEALQRWNSPPINRYRVLATFWSFLVLGMGDGSYGALLPYLETYYDLDYTVVSLVFLSPFAGYAMASTVNNLVHVNFGQRGVACVAPLCHFIPYLVFSFHPPYPVLVILFVIVGFGNGLIDAAWCSFIGVLANSHVMSGILQSFYALGATVSPLIATALARQGGPNWSSFYYVMVAASTVELVTSAAAFWKQTGAIYLAENPNPTSGKGRTRQALSNKFTWIFVFFMFGYCGLEVAIGGWIVVFMTRVRGSSPFAGGAAATGFWGGMTAGRLFLSILTSRLGESKSMLLYLGLAITFELTFWLIPNLVVTAVSVALLGFFLGPMFPTAVVLITKVLPRRLHVGTIGFATAFGGSGGAILPFVVGAIAQAKGVETIQPIILATFVVLAVLWGALPHREPQGHHDDSDGRASPREASPEAASAERG
ncbi:hypothetical protein MMC10_006004 [Thelotrema lepadinum]|nr:hypothetical protein [Thelotrema lepadinum]